MNARAPAGRTMGKWLLGLAALLAVVLPAAFLVHGRARAAVTLIYFQAITAPDFVRVEWATATELDNAGFFVLRSETGGNNPSDYEQITVIDAVSGIPYDFIPARGDDLIGATYLFQDQEVEIGTRYYYFLQDVDSSNFSSYHGPVEAVAGQTPTPTGPAGGPSATPTTPTGTNTGPSPTPSRTPTRTNTPLPGFVPTSTPTISPTPTGTLPPSPTATFTESPIPPVDLTLTGIAAALTGMPTITPTWTASPDRSANPPTRTPTPTDAPLEEAGPAPGLPAGRIALIVVVFLASGALLTAGIVFFARGAGQAGDPVDGLPVIPGAEPPEEPDGGGPSEPLDGLKDV